MGTLYVGGGYFSPQGVVVEGHGVLVEDATIRRVAKAAEFGSAAGGNLGAERVDTTGCTLLPGLMDCHVHLVLGGEANPQEALQGQTPGQITLRALLRAQQTLRGGITAVRDCGGKDYLEFAVRDFVAQGLLAGPTIRAVGRLICMTGGHGHRMGRIADGPEEVVRAVREQIQAGCDQIKIMATGGVLTPGVDPREAHYTPEEIRAGIQEAARFSRKSASHAQGTQGILNAVRGGVTSIEHGIYLTEECVREMIERGTILVPTLAAPLSILRGAARGIPAYVLEKTHMVAEHHRASVKMFYRAGGKLAMGTDAGTPFNLHGENAQELEYMVDEGIRPADALLAATVNAAELLSLPAQGRIAEGSAADLLLVQGDPTQDIHAVSRRTQHRAVYKAGRLVA